MQAGGLKGMSLKKSVQIICSAAVIAVNTGCAENNPFAGRERHQAPNGAGDVGVLVERAPASEIQSILEENPEAKVRVLNKEHGLYEIFGVSADAVRAKTTAVTSQNHFFKMIEPQTPGLFSISAPAGLKVDGLETCGDASPGPQAVMTIDSPLKDLNGATISPTQKIKVNSSNSRSHASVGGALKAVVVVIAPQLSAEGSRVIQSDSAEFTPDALGIYQVVVVVQDTRKSCAVDGVQFLVSDNKPFRGPQSEEVRGDFLNQMKHLDMVNAKEAWEISQGEGMTIAIIDSGVNYNHPTLAANIQLNSAEIPDNGRDDDGNGFKDDYVGYDFVNQDEFPYDDDGHGSHVSGLAASKHFGVAKRAKILAIKGLSGMGGDVGTISAALRYAVDRGARIVNMSLGGPSPLPHPAIVSAMRYAESKNVLVVISAGNGDPQTGLGFSIDDVPFYPAGLPQANILSVASFDKDNVLSTYSNFGQRNVDVVAPGGAMPSDPMFSATLENAQGALFAGMSGTSMAAPVVSGIAAQVWSLQPELTVGELKAILLKAGTAKPELARVTVSGRHINALQALNMAQGRNLLF